MQKPIVLITSRVHPGETPASWIMQGLVEFLTSREHKAQTLREKFIFKVGCGCANLVRLVLVRVRRMLLKG